MTFLCGGYSPSTLLKKNLKCTFTLISSMKKCRSIVIVFLLFVCIINARAQNRNNLVLGKDHLILLIDLRSSKTELDSIFKAAGIKGVTASAVLKGDFSALKKDGWNVTERQSNVIQFNKALTDLN